MTSTATSSSSSNSLSSDVIVVTGESVSRDENNRESSSKEKEQSTSVITSFPPTTTQKEEEESSSTTFQEPEKETGNKTTETSRKTPQEDDEVSDTLSGLENATEAEGLFAEVTHLEDHELSSVTNIYSPETTKTTEDEVTTKNPVDQNGRQTSPIISDSNESTTSIPDVTNNSLNMSETTTVVPEVEKKRKEAEHRCPSWYSFIPNRKACELTPIDSFRRFWTSFVPRHGPHRFWTYFWGRN